VITAILFGKLWALFEAFIAHLESICTAVGMLAIAVPAIDAMIHRAIARWPKVKAWQILDKIFFGCGVALVNIGNVLNRMLAKRRDIQNGPTCP